MQYFGINLRGQMYCIFIGSFKGEINKLLHLEKNSAMKEKKKKIN